MDIKRDLFLIALSFICINTQAQVVAFTADTLRGCGNLTVQFTDQSTGANAWQWDFDDDGNIDSDEQNPVYTYTQPGFYSVSLTINNTVTEEKQDYITIAPNPDSTFFFQDTLGLGTFNYVFRNVNQVLENRINYNRNWQFSDGITATGKKIIRTFPDTGMYRVRLTVAIDGFPRCRSQLTRTVRVLKEIFVPNVFTPNDDGQNDLFIIRYNNQDNLDFRVYSRYGNLVFKNKSPVVVWDGISLSGLELNPGVYYYTLVSDDGVVNRSGFIHLFR
jgi:gliding motility-associated-like protein